MSKWFTVEKAAERVGKSPRTIERWIDDGMQVQRGLVREDVLLEKDAEMRERGARRGRPRASSRRDDVVAETLELAAQIAESSGASEAAEQIRLANRLS